MRIEFCLNLQTRCGRGVPNQVHNHFIARQGFPFPVDTDKREQAVFDLVPFTGAGGKVTDRNF